MFCPRALVIIIAATAFSATAFAQTRGSALIIEPIIASAVPSRAMPNAPPDNPPPCESTICKSVQRYAKTRIVSATEFFYYPDGHCTFADPGKWKAPTDIVPQVNGKPAGTVTVNVPPQGIPGPTPINPYTGATCTGGGTYMYAPLYFTWELHKNSTAVPRFGPTATFSSTWKGDFGSFFDETFEISVPVVRPIGEWSTFQSWVLGSVSDWQQTLVPPDDERGKGFDFVGDCVKERVWPIHLGLTLPACSPDQGGGEAEWVIQPGSHYVDEIGRINDFKELKCINALGQNMYFMSQAERDYSPIPYTKFPNTIIMKTEPDTILPNVVRLNNLRRTAFSPNDFKQTFFDVSVGQPIIGDILHADTQDCLAHIRAGG